MCEPEQAPIDVPAPTFPQKRADALVAMADLAMTALAADGKPARNLRTLKAGMGSW